MRINILNLSSFYFKLHDLRGLSIGPVVETPSKSSFLTEDPMKLFLNGKFHKVPLLATYADKERLLFMRNEQSRIKTGENDGFSVEPEDVIPPIFKDQMDDINFEIISSEMKGTYSSDDFSEKLCLVSNGLKI